MIDNLLFVVLPYLAVVICAVGSFIRIKWFPMSYSSLSSQFLEGKTLVWGSVPWHAGIGLILAGHLIAIFFPSLWQSWISNQSVLLVVETTGVALGVGCLIGLIVLGLRRVLSARLQAVTTTMDLVVLALLALQVICGLAIAVHCRWGAAWMPATASPYIYSLLTFQPDVTSIASLPFVVKAHVVGAWLIILVVPFSRLIHMFAAPLEYITRPPQNVIWNNPRRQEATPIVVVKEEARRDFIKGSVGMALGGTILGVGAFDKIYNFFFGPRLSPKQEEEQMALRLKRLQATAEQRKLELERQSSEYILVAAMEELSDTTGKYFIDYQMLPALAFKGADGLPILMSAKCTHLGCTVGNEVSEGRILCPCHVSFFDIQTGKPNEGAPAKAPLPMLGWVILDKKGNKVAGKDGHGKITGNTSAGALAGCNVYIVKPEVA